VLLTPPPYRNPQQLALIKSVRTDGLPGLRAWPAQQWMEWQRQAQSFEALAAYSWTFNFLVSEEGSESLEGMAVTRDYFRVIGVQPDPGTNLPGV
jgi:putative ABC transport system permease protein